jgi:hypothetical protein
MIAARELVDADATVGRVLFVEHTFLYDPLVRAMNRPEKTAENGTITGGRAG